MSFFNKIKQSFGIGTLKVELQAPAQLGSNERQINGQVLITAQSDQLVKEIKLRMLETYTQGKGDDEKSKEYELGQKIIKEPLTLAKDENTTIDFSLPFILQHSNNQSLSQEKGVLGALGKAAIFATGEKSEYQIKVDVYMEGSMFSISDSQNVRFI